MSGINYYAHPSAYRPPHKTGLTVWGVLMIVVGSLLALSSLIAAIAVPVMKAFSGPSGHVTPRLVATLVAGALTSGAMGGGLIWLGTASCRGRRWVGPIIVAGGSLVVFYGATSLIHLTANLAKVLVQPPPAAMAAAGPFPPKALLVFSAAVAVAVDVGMMIVLPAFMVAFYRQPSVAAALAASDPVPRWTDRVPLPRLAWVLACAHSGIVMALVAAGGTWVAFAYVLDGWPAVIALVVTGALLVIAAIGSMRRSALGAAIGIATYLLLAASTITFAATGDVKGYFDRIVQSMTVATTGPAAQNNGIAQGQAMNGPALWYGTGTLYALLAAYGGWVMFVRSPDPRSTTEAAV